MLHFGEFSNRLLQDSEFPTGPKISGLFDVFFKHEPDDDEDGGVDTRIRVTQATLNADPNPVVFRYLYIGEGESDKVFPWNVMANEHWLIGMERNLRGRLTFIISNRNPNDRST